MSESPLPQNPNLVLSPEWKALANVGNAFRWIYYSMVITLILAILLVAAFLATGLIAGVSDKTFDPKEDLVLLLLENRFFLIPFCIALLALSLFNLIVWFHAYFRFWFTPGSLVPGGKIARTYVIMCLLGEVIGLFQYWYKETVPETSLMFGLLGGFILIASYIIFLVYSWRLASAIDSQSVKPCIKWIVFGCLGMIFLAFIRVSEIAAVAAIQDIGFCLFVFIFYLANMLLFGCMANDTADFVEDQCREYAEALNLEGQPNETN